MRGTRQGRTIKLRLEGRLLCLWGLLGREVSLERGELSLLPLTDLGPQPSDPIGDPGPPASLSWAGGATVRRLASQRSCLNLRQGDERNESPVNGAGGEEGHRRVDETVKDQQTLGQTDGHGKGRRGAARTHSLENTGGAQPRQHLPTPTLHFPRLPQSQKAVHPLGLGQVLHQLQH